MSPQQSPEPQPAASAEAITGEFANYLYPLEKSQLIPRSLSFTLSGENREQDICRIAEALGYVHSSTRVELSAEEITELIAMISNHARAIPDRQELLLFADSIGVTHSRSFLLTAESCQGRITSQVNIEDKDAPVFTQFAIELRRTNQKPAGTDPVFRVAWPREADAEGLLSVQGWKLADPMLFALTEAPFPSTIQGEDQEDHEYLVSINAQVYMGVSYCPVEGEVSIAPVRAFEVNPNRARIASPHSDGTPAETSLDRRLSKSNCLVASIDVLNPGDDELQRALSAIGIELPANLISHLTETIQNSGFLTIEEMQNFCSEGGPVRISQVSHASQIREEGAPAPYSYERDEGEDADDDFEDQDIAHEMEESIDIALDLEDKSKQITVTLKLSEEFSDDNPTMIVRVEFFSVSNVYSDEQVAERWSIAEKFIRACNGPHIPELLESLTQLERDEEFDSYQLDPDGRFLINPEPSIT